MELMCQVAIGVGDTCVAGRCRGYLAALTVVQVMLSAGVSTSRGIRVKTLASRKSSASGFP